ncbi:MerR family transcriptional regulator [Sulfurospirillum sp. 1612]|uniref:MerR family transcriptional regulator n=1 Tax=Sulfurospirillum sp. 1612 TaxID=3094835 RepID=UPI002F95ED7A
MALLDNDKNILPISSIAEILATKPRTLKMYEEKGLLPQERRQIKKLYSINDIKLIAFVHYLASVKKINAHGIKFILDMLYNNIDEQNRQDFINKVELEMEKISGNDVKDIETM